ncbi:MAG: NADH-quinone oxidoreductase subunit L [Actinomycetota bacterium]|nr:NADH-quinone oxidoreductase subunit L [Actinomycetota bacterium]
MLELAWLIPALPLAGFVALLVLGRRLGEPLAGWLATAAIGTSFLVTLLVFLGLVDKPAEERYFLQDIFTWVPAGSFSVDVGFLVDPLSITMCLFITGVGALIHLYSIGYMHGDPNFSKFFLYLNLFAASMLLLVVGPTLLLTFLGWEGVGACSYLLISFWFEDPANASAGKKAFVTNRVGDFGFMLGLFAVFSQIGSIRYADILTSPITTGWATAMVLLFLLAAAGKSAQIPLFVWLPDAMAGPTPVSALIHAATMVTSGVYLLTRLNPILAQADPWATSVVAWIGAITALVAALAAVVQNDIKKVLAYSTVSQLGYLFLAVGVGGYIPAIFHMVTHAFFKALLFLGSGSVIHGLHGEQDMRRMGGLYRIMPITAGTFIVGWLAIAGVPPFSGFWSKDEILLAAWNAPNGGKVLWVIGLVTALLTAFYMTRQVILTFFGRPRFFDAHQDEIDAAFAASAQAAMGQVAEVEAAVAKAVEAVDKARADVLKRTDALAEAGADVDTAKAAVAASRPDDEGHAKLVKAVEKAEKAVPKAQTTLDKADAKLAEAEAELAAAEEAVEAALAEAEASAADTSGIPRVPQHATAFTDAPDVSSFEDAMPPSFRHRQEYHPHESPITMTLPLVALAGLAAAGGLLNLPFAHDLHFLGNWLEPSLFGNEAHGSATAATKWVLAIVAVLVGLTAIAAAFLVYVRRQLDPAEVEKPGLALAVRYDQALADLSGGPGRKFFDLVAWVDRTFVDGAVNGVARLAQTAGEGLRSLQPGLVRNYALSITLGGAFVSIWFLVRLWSEVGS